MIKLIACIDKYSSLGINNNLIYFIKEDLKIFKEKTINNIVVMGRKTFNSLNNKPLPNRENIIISRNLCNPKDKSYTVFNDINSVLKLNTPKDIFIIGGSKIYKYFTDFYDEIHLTMIKDKYTKVYPINQSVKLNIQLNNFKLIDQKEYDIFFIKIYQRIK
ncbi:dihydrofolate reductase [Candidatus Arthromitus sp. SFB-mouse-Japan]|uniref:dihydrofolate reductase n=1 Tax=unclassified Candidatus Neoarthromitus TaxID=2638829 RepID=UPI00021B7E9F|nr:MULTISPECIES: dihydrofolate reductase [unclassified Candidatus Arthromitus]EIA21998.1 Dihydrofolate reductase [Candidatus Arthromitus sp. SFB-1]EIA25894.1 Dihydrofolate reductase [Candidatus Arthromitus sp. SFB-4]EIA26335.1 Dihydrofolate reductase [Candidatus Arthromitus sp. SFB-5]EIA27588.1 Dihydrofolate reductase [Candidatus Arthromitus sp. SFB-co]EIA30500.1 Dihydrofolate reductase [Candidatus Arthromitus sp. SFB-mouse-SU]